MPRRQACTSKAALRSARGGSKISRRQACTSKAALTSARRKQDATQTGVHKQSRVVKRAEEARCRAGRRAQAKPR